MNPNQNQPQWQGGYGPVQESFTSKAVWTLVLYFVFYIPGLIANLVFWNEAREVKNRTGNPPAGYGCLVAMLIVQAIFMGIICMLMGLGNIGRR